MLRFWSVVAAAASWWLSTVAARAVLDDRIDGEVVLTMVVGFGLAVLAVLIIPIDRIWLRWTYNSLVLVYPTLTLAVLIAGLFRA